MGHFGTWEQMFERRSDPHPLLQSQHFFITIKAFFG